MYIYPINSGGFLGFNNNVETLISFSNTECTYPININTITPSSKVASVTVSGVIPNDSTPNISSTQTGNNKTVTSVVVSAANPTPTATPVPIDPKKKTAEIQQDFVTQVLKIKQERDMAGCGGCYPPRGSNADLLGMDGKIQLGVLTGP